MRGLVGTALRKPAPVAIPPVFIPEHRSYMTHLILHDNSRLEILSLLTNFPPLRLRYRGGKCPYFSSIRFIAEKKLALLWPFLEAYPSLDVHAAYLLRWF